MKELPPFIYQMLLNDTDITDVVGDRVYRTRLPRKPSYPLILFNYDDDDDEATRDGPLGMIETPMGIECRDTDQDVANDLVDKVRVLFAGYSGTAYGCEVLDIERQSISDSFIPPDDGGEKGI